LPSRPYSQNSGFVRRGALPSSAGLSSSPSGSNPFGGFAPQSLHSVGNRSTPASTVASFVTPAGTTPGPQAISGSRMPPSYRLSLLPRRPAVRFRPNVGSGPLSDRNSTTVGRPPLRARTAPRSRPTCRSSSVRTFASRPGVAPLPVARPPFSTRWSSADGTHGVCGSSSHRFTKHGRPGFAFRKSSARSTIHPVRSHRFTLSAADQIQSRAVRSGCGWGPSQVPRPTS
jgi:hypothetical protein